MPGKTSMIICSLAMFIFSVLSVVPETSPAVIDAGEMRLEAQKLKILQGESGCRHYDRAGKIIRGDGGRALGIAQFHRATFENLKKLAGRPELSILDKDDQLWLFDWAIRNGHAHNWTVARWLAAKEKPEFPIAQKHKLVKGSKKCPTYKPVMAVSAPDVPENIAPRAPSGPVFEMPLVVNI